MKSFLIRMVGVAVPVCVLVGGAALTPQRAAELMENPELETSWRVLDAACRIMRRPLWEIAPNPPWQPPVRVVIESPAF